MLKTSSAFLFQALGGVIETYKVAAGLSFHLNGWFRVE
jgi:hypothetical protein